MIVFYSSSFPVCITSLLRSVAFIFDFVNLNSPKLLVVPLGVNFIILSSESFFGVILVNVILTFSQFVSGC